jgi:hypothetical protein
MRREHPHISSPAFGRGPTCEALSVGAPQLRSGTFSGTLQPNFQRGSHVTITNGNFNVPIDAP